MIGNPVAKWPYGIAPKLGDLYATHTHKRKGGHVRICRIEGDALLHIYAWLECYLRWRRSSIQPRRCYSGRAERRLGMFARLIGIYDPMRTGRPFWPAPPVREQPGRSHIPQVLYMARGEPASRLAR